MLVMGRSYTVDQHFTFVVPLVVRSESAFAGALTVDRGGLPNGFDMQKHRASCRGGRDSERIQNYI